MCRVRPGPDIKTTDQARGATLTPTPIHPHIYHGFHAAARFEVGYRRHRMDFPDIRQGEVPCTLCISAEVLTRNALQDLLEDTKECVVGT